ncbi:MAG: (Fe-S)-binding protein [Candidatus Helarchaeota archaeon]|nr:(Fe-S)-binding protein [Candidatus Helarchaeota archaeon]
MAIFSELKKYQDMMDFCGKCGDCASSGTQITTAKRHVTKPCPVKNVLGFEAYDARGRILILKKLIDEKLDTDNSILKWAYTCTGCGSCKETCLAIEGGINTPLLMEALRQDFVNQELKIEKHQQILDSILQNNNPYNEPKEIRSKILSGRKFNPDAEYLVFLGCTSSYRQQNIALSTIELLDNLGIEYSILENEPCCGSILKRYGYKNEFETIARKNLELFKKNKIKKIIFPCAGCYRTFKIDYAELDKISIQFYHLTEFLDQYFNENFYKFKMKHHKKISYHDPCHLGRHSGVYEAPRSLLKRIKNSNFIELDALRNYSHCCGAGGGVKSSEPDLAQKIAVNRNEEAIEKGIEILVSACPFCEKNLKDGLNGANLEILDISEVLLRSIEKEMESQIMDDSESEIKIGKKYMKFLAQYPDIFSDLVTGSILDFAIYVKLDDLEEERPLCCFNVLRTENGIALKSGKADDPDLELAVSTDAVNKLVLNDTKSDYAKQFGIFYNEPDEEDGWIDFVLHKRTKTLIKMGYGKFAEEAGILEDEDEI